MFDSYEVLPELLAFFRALKHTEFFCHGNGELVVCSWFTCSWGDSVLEDTEKTFQRRFQMAQVGYLKPELVVSYEFGCSEDEARKLMPSGGMTLFGGGTDAVS